MILLSLFVFLSGIIMLFVLMIMMGFSCGGRNGDPELFLKTWLVISILLIGTGLCLIGYDGLKFFGVI
jgi:hypothetical protein